MTEHTVKAFDDDINALRALIAEMGGLTEDAIDNAMKALTTRDEDLAQKVVEGDKRIDELDAQIEKLVVQTIALRAPLADDLREIIAVLKISNVVELSAETGTPVAFDDASAQECVDSLVAAALDGGGSDNITVILVRCH